MLYILPGLIYIWLVAGLLGQVCLKRSQVLLLLKYLWEKSTLCCLMRLIGRSPLQSIMKSYTGIVQAPLSALFSAASLIQTPLSQMIPGSILDNLKEMH